MRKNSCNKGNWSNYIKSIKRCNWSFLSSTFSALSLIFLFLIIKSFEIQWLVLFILSSLFLLLINWKLYSFIILLGFIIFLIWWLINNLNHIPKQINGDFKVSDKTSNGIVIQYGINKIFIKTQNSIEIDDWINLKNAQIKKIDWLNNQDNYLKSKGIYFLTTNIEMISVQKNHSIYQQIINYFSTGPFYYSKYVPLTIFGNKNDWNLEIYEKLKSISIIHLFTVSGFHINFWIILINRFLKILKIKNVFIYTFSSLIIIPYLWMLNFSISSLRAFFLSFLIIVNKNHLKNKMDSINILGFVMFVFFVINPNIIFSISFIFSFMLTYVVMLTARCQNDVFKKTKIILNCWIVSTTIIIFINKEFSINGIANNLIFSPLIILVYFLTSTLFFIKPLIDNIFLLLDTTINFIHSFLITIKFNLNIHLVILIISAILIYLIIKNKNEYYTLKKSCNKINY